MEARAAAVVNDGGDVLFDLDRAFSVLESCDLSSRGFALTIILKSDATGALEMPESMISSSLRLRRGQRWRDATAELVALGCLEITTQGERVRFALRGALLEARASQGEVSARWTGGEHEVDARWMRGERDVSARWTRGEHEVDTPANGKPQRKRGSKVRGAASGTHPADRGALTLTLKSSQIHDSTAERTLDENGQPALPGMPPPARRRAKIVSDEVFDPETMPGVRNAADFSPDFPVWPVSWWMAQYQWTRETLRIGSPNFTLTVNGIDRDFPGALWIIAWLNATWPALKHHFETKKERGVKPNEMNTAMQWWRSSIRRICTETPMPKAVLGELVSAYLEAKRLFDTETFVAQCNKRRAERLAESQPKQQVTVPIENKGKMNVIEGSDVVPEVGGDCDDF